MSTVTILGWDRDFQKVQFTRLLRAVLGYSLADAKAATDDVLAHKHLELHVPEAEVEEFLPHLREIGAIFAVTDQPHYPNQARNDLRVSRR